MPYYQYTPSPVRCTTWDEADAWIRGGRNPDTHRQLKSKIRKLTRGEHDDIIFSLWITPIITYHRDGTFTLRHDGHTTQTTIWDLQHHCPTTHLVGVPGSRVVKEDEFGNERKQNWCSRWAIRHESDPLSPPRVQKCRRCDDGQVHPWVCTPYNRWEMNDTTGMYEKIGVGPCKHGYLRRHSVTACEQCCGTGRCDYGSKPIHTPFDGPVHVDATGRVLRRISPIEEWANLIARVKKTRQRLYA